MKLLINASNLHVGGGIQVAASFLHELSKHDAIDSSVIAHISTDVYSALNAVDPDASKTLAIDVLDVNGINFKQLFSRSTFKECEAVFTIFGPLYTLDRSFKNIVGFAQPWIIYPDNECYAMLSFKRRLLIKLKFSIQKWFYRRADILVVESEHVKNGLIRELHFPAERIFVVHNSVSSVYLDKNLWAPLPNIPNCHNLPPHLKLGFIGRNYLHKNTAIFPAIHKELREQHGIESRFYVTFTNEEWAACSNQFRDACVNVGPLSVAQCPHFYNMIDYVVFPSLLECFSATPLETMVMKKAIFASDRPFNRDICGPFAYYFDPLSHRSAARAIANLYAEDGPDLIKLKMAREHALSLGNATKRAAKYLEILTA